MTKLALALASLVRQIAAGREYPDAHGSVCYSHKLTQAQAMTLRDRYDAWCADGQPTLEA